MDDDSTDRMLVRPYVQSGAEKPGAEPKVSSIHTEEIPQPAPAPARGEEENTAVLPVIKASPAAESDGGRRLVLWLVGAGLALILVAAVAVVALWPGGDEDRSAALPGTSVLPGSGAAPASASPPRSAAPSETLAPPPAVDRIGAITGPGGHCLDLRGGVALPGGAVSAYACNGTPSQRWTLGADGTLRVGGMCATPDGSAVHLGGCDASAQWRAGSGGTLVNAGAARCLTDPDNGTTTGARMTLATCGGTGQRWTLP
jgi:hypothetical protein